MDGLGERARWREGGNWVSEGGILPEDVGITLEFDGPFCLAAVAFSLVGRHD